MTPKTALILDHVCWTSATLLALGLGHPTIAALVGATGAVYLIRAQQAYERMKRNSQ